MNTNAESAVDSRIVQKLMRSARRLSRQIDRSLDYPAPGWSHASFDPMLLLDAFLLLWLRDGYKLEAYQYYEAGDGNGFVFAVPLGRSLPDPPPAGFGFDPAPSGPPLFTPAGRLFPDWARADFERFLEGDGSPLSYFQASIFVRELREMGAFRHESSWPAHEVLTSAVEFPRQRWRWQEEEPRQWCPSIRRLSGGEWQVSFYTHTGLGRERIFRHIDTYTEGYSFESDERVVAFGEGGYLL